MRTELINPVVDSRWGAFVDTVDDATVFHHPAWLRLLSEQYGYQLRACCVLDETESIVAGLPFADVRSWLTGHRLIALPFSDICAPIAVSTNADAARLLFDALDDERRRTGTELQVRGPVDFTGPTLVTESFYHHVIPLHASFAEVEAGFRKSQVKRGIAKAVRSGVTIERTTSESGLDAFYALHLETRRRQGVPTQPKRFIRRLSTLFSQGLGHVLLARLDGEPIAAAVFLNLRGTLTYKYGASSRQHLDARPNNLLFAEALRGACESGFAALDLGRTDLDNAGLRSFKLAWGADETVLEYRVIGRARQPSAGRRTSGLAGTIIRRAPLAGRVIGATLYRHYA